MSGSRWAIAEVAVYGSFVGPAGFVALKRQRSAYPAIAAGPGAACKCATEQGATHNRVRGYGLDEFDGHDLDLIRFMDCLHDLGDPVGALARGRMALKPDGTVPPVGTLGWRPAGGEPKPNRPNVPRRAGDGVHAELADIAR
jgi:hypothetical protein